MSFVSVPGLKGKVYVPDGCRKGSKKYPCKDCFSCQQCSDDRCRVCLSAKTCKCHDALKSIKDGPALSKGMATCGCEVMEYWSIGMLEEAIRPSFITPELHYPNVIKCNFYKE